MNSGSELGGLRRPTRPIASANPVSTGPGAQRGDRDALLAHLLGQRLGVRQHERLARRRSRPGPGSGWKAAVDATLSTAPRPALDHPGHERAAQVGDGLDVGADHRDLLGRVALVDRSHGGEPGVVHEHVDGEAALLDVGDELRRASASSAEVGDGDLGADAVGRRQLVGERPQRLLPPGDEGDAMAALGQLPGQVDPMPDEAPVMRQVRSGPGAGGSCRSVGPARPERLTSG